MGIATVHYADEERLELIVDGNLDLTLTGEILHICSLIDQGVRTCVIDATRITRVFDSGIGLMMFLMERLKAVGVQLVMIGEIPRLAESSAGRV